MAFGVYIHFPYCLSKCPYCDFASRAEKVIPQRRYTDAVLRELDTRSREFGGREAVSIYFGGGTPSLWDPPLFAQVLRGVRSLWRVRDDAEITLEANPGTTDEERFAAFREAGANRISIGVQSFAPAQLISLGRKHSPGDAVHAYQTARKAGFANVSLDLIHGVERQTRELAARDAAAAVALGPEHISCYALTLTGLAEEVPMAKAVQRGEISLPDDDAAADMGEADFCQPGGDAGHTARIHAQEGAGTLRGEEADQGFSGLGTWRDDRTDHLAASERPDCRIALDGAIAADDRELPPLRQRIDQSFAVGAVSVAVQCLDFR